MNIMKDVLLIVSSDILMGGVFTFIEQWVENTPDNTNSYTLYYNGIVKSKEMYERLKGLGIELVAGNYDKLPFIKSIFAKAKRLKNFSWDIKQLLKKNKYDVVHVISGNVNCSAIVAKLSKKFMVKLRIVYCINNGLPISEFKERIVNISRKIIIKNATRLSACSFKAAEFMFGKDNAKKALIINPCSDCKKYVFSQSARDKIRSKYKLQDHFVIGNMARFDPQKNHLFLLDIFKEIVSINENARLMLVGNGETEREIRKKVSDIGLENKVIFCGSTDHPQDYFCAMDAFVFPCIYEGLGQVAIHAQNSGLKTLCSEEVPKETKITELIEYMSLNESPQKWAEKILSYNNGYKREDMSEKIIKADYDISSISKFVNQVYGD